MATAVQVESLWNGITDTSGNALAGGKVYTYSAGTTTPVALFTTSDKSVQATNPIILDSSGKAQVYADGRYKFVIKTSAEATLYTLDNLLYGFDDSRVLWGGLSTGSANTQAVSVPDILASYSNGQRVSFVAGFTNSGAMTLNINSLGAVSIVKGASNTPLASGDIVAGQLVSCTYYGGAFKLDGDLYPAATANVPMGGFKHTNCANATADTEYTTLGQIKAGVTIQTNGANGPNLNIQNYNTGNVGPRLEFYKSRNGTVGGNTIVQNGDTLGGVWFYGASGATATPAAAITGEIDGVPGATNDMPGRLVLYTTADGSGTLTERLRITNAGYVGLSTTAPTDTLHVKGAIRLDNNYTPTWDTGGRIWLEAGFGNRYDGYAHRFDVGNTRTEAMRILPSAEILISKTTVTVAGSGSYFTQAGNGGHPAIMVNTKTASGAVQTLQNHHNGVYVGGVTYDNTSTSFPTSSDYRLKENLEPLEDGVTRVKNLNPIRFNFISEPDSTIDGFLAHEVADYVPNAVSGEKDAAHEDGSIKVQSLDHSKLVPLLTAAIKELVARVEALEAQLA